MPRPIGTWVQRHVSHKTGLRQGAFDQITKSELEQAARDAAAGVIAELVGGGAEETADYVATVIAMRNALVAREDALLGVMNVGGRNYLARLAALDEITETTHATIRALNTSPLRERVAASQIDHTTILEMLREREPGYRTEVTQRLRARTGLDRRQGEVPLETLRSNESTHDGELAPFAFNLTTLCLDALIGPPEEHEEGGEQAEWTPDAVAVLAYGLRTIFSEAGPKVTKAYRDHFLTAVRETIGEPGEGRKTVVRRFNVSLRRSAELMEPLHELVDAYSGLKPEDLKLLTVLTTAELPREEAVPYVSTVSEVAEARHKGLAARILRGIDPDDRVDLFEAMITQPKLLALYANLRRASASPQFADDEFAQVVLSPLAEQHGATLLEDVLTVSEIASQRKAAVTLTRNAIEASADGSYDKIIKIAIDYKHGAHEILEDYFAARADGKVARAAVALEIGLHGPDQQRLKLLRRKLYSLSEGELQSVYERPTTRDVVEALHKFKKPLADIPRRAKRQADSWFSRRIALMDEPQQWALRAAYDALGDGMPRRRLRYVMRREPQVIKSFVEDAKL